MINWYLLAVTSGTEFATRNRLNFAGFNSYAPEIPVNKRTRMDVEQKIEPMFFGYMFIELEEGVDDFGEVKQCPNVLAFIKSMRGGYQYPAKVPDEVILEIRDREGEHKVTKELYDYQPNEDVRVKSGPFRDYVGRILSVGTNERVKILLDSLNGGFEIDTGYGRIEPA